MKKLSDSLVMVRNELNCIAIQTLATVALYKFDSLVLQFMRCTTSV